MKYIFKITIVLFSTLLFFTCSNDDNNDGEPSFVFKLEDLTVNGAAKADDTFSDVPPQTNIKLTFSAQVDKTTIEGNIRLTDKDNQNIKFSYALSDGDRVINITPPTLKSYSTYKLIIYPDIKSISGTKIFTGKTFGLSTTIDLADKFPRISDKKLLDLVQKQTFRYFWDFGHPTSGMARERTTSGNTVTSGGTGFGVMAVIVASQRGFVTRSQASERVLKILTFLDQRCTKYHGAFAHWINGETGNTVPFSATDNGGDLVETSLLMQGLLAARQYFDAADNTETQIRNTITRLWEAVEWTWYQQNGSQSLYWHWSPEYGWEINLRISGWNEALITYVLAASSPTYPISKEVYNAGWTRNGAFRNGKSFYGINLPLGEDYGGPMFLSHYSFMGINPKGLTDNYADYWVQAKNHTLINYNYCVQNPKGYAGYSADCWGLTASDGNKGYSAHSPTNDKGVIAPTAAISSLPYTPEQSMNALRFFYYKLGDKLWSDDYGFYDAFNMSEQWVDNQQIAIDQGPQIVMIENYRSGLIWSLFMSAPEIKTGLKTLGFSSPYL